MWTSIKCLKREFFDGLRLRSDLVPEHGALVQFLMGTYVNTPFFQVPTPEFGHGSRARVQGLDLVLGHWTRHWFPVCTRFSLVPLRFTHKPLLCVPPTPWYANIKMASDGTRWSKDKINALIDAYSDAKMSGDPMTTNRELYSSIKSLLELTMTFNVPQSRSRQKWRNLNQARASWKTVWKYPELSDPMTRNLFQVWKRSLFNTGIILTAF